MHPILNRFGIQRGAINGFIGLVAISCLAAIGCGGSNRPVMHTVEGRVSFQGSPVEEGTITFENPANGFANSVKLGDGGVYTLQLPDGSYQVNVEPPMIPLDAGPNSPPSEGYKNVKNIPAKYRRSRSSGLTVQVSGSNVTQNFNMIP
jgi:hypothetical protein